EQEIVEAFRGGHWRRLLDILAFVGQGPHPLAPATLQQLHYLASCLSDSAGTPWPEREKTPGGSLAQALYGACKLLRIAPDEDLEWAFEQSLTELAPYLSGDRPGLIELLEGVAVDVEGLVQTVLAGLNRRLDLEVRIGGRYQAFE